MLLCNNSIDKTVHSNNKAKPLAIGLALEVFRAVVPFVENKMSSLSRLFYYGS